MDSVLDAATNLISQIISVVCWTEHLLDGRLLALIPRFYDSSTVFFSLSKLT